MTDFDQWHLKTSLEIKDLEQNPILGSQPPNLLVWMAASFGRF